MKENEISKDESIFLAYLRGVSIFIIVFGHVGGFWIFRPYSEFLHVFVPMFFFISGAVSYLSYKRSPSVQFYYKKRITGLLIPYYLLCSLSIVVFIVQNGHIPSFNIQNIIAWLLVNPSNAIMPFPIGQVWFLNTLVLIIIVSPLYFNLKKKSETMLVLLLIILVGISGIQLFYDIDNFFIFLNNNFYKPIIHSSFFIYGVLYISIPKFNKISVLIPLMILSLFLSVALAKFLKLNIDYAFHIYAPDVYYVLGSFSVIIYFILIKTFFVQIVNKIGIFRIAITYLYKHTFSIFLLHSFVIYLFGVIFVVNQEEKTILYGIIKLIIVLFITCLFAKPYSMISNYIISKALKIIGVMFESGVRG